jgi:Asp-tRNA(Asn)/Glu-tRNA(Gln) amidotransferase C subunit
MGDLNADEVRSLAAACGLTVPDQELPILTTRFNGMMDLLKPLDTLPLENEEIIPTLLTQREV